MAGFDPKFESGQSIDELRGFLTEPGPDRVWYVADAFRQGMSLEDVFQLTKIDRWYLVQIQEIVEIENNLASQPLSQMTAQDMRALKRKGFADKRLADLLGVSQREVRRKRQGLGVRPVYKRVDTCAAEFDASTAYMYSSYDEECEANPTDNDKIMVLGGGPNRIGQGIEFDYCCVHAALAMRDDGYETIMVNCNPETVSTDYDTSDRLYFEPLTLEDVLEIVEVEKPKGVIIQFGGQTPLKLARALAEEGVPIIGTSPEAIDRAEDRERFQQMVERLNLRQPPNAIARSTQEGVLLAEKDWLPLGGAPLLCSGWPRDGNRLFDSRPRALPA